MPKIKGSFDPKKSGRNSTPSADTAEEKQVAGLAALATELFGEKRISLAEANRMGYFTANQFALHTGVSLSHISKSLRSNPVMERVQIRDHGVTFAYRKKKIK